MNALSWALYAADALGKLSVLMALLAVALGPLRLVVTAFQRDNVGMSYSNSKPWPWPKGSVIASILIAIVACALPSTKTVYLIVASEAGERVANSADGREMLDLIRAKIRAALAEKS